MNIDLNFAEISLPEAAGHHRSSEVGRLHVLKETRRKVFFIAFNFKFSSLRCAICYSFAQKLYSLT